MGRPKKSPEDLKRQKNLLSVRGTEEWKIWLDGLAAKQRVPIVVLIDVALTELAKAVGYPEPPPRV